MKDPKWEERIEMKTYLLSITNPQNCIEYLSRYNPFPMFSHYQRGQIKGKWHCEKIYIDKILIVCL